MNNQNIKIPKLNTEKKIRIILFILVTIYMIINCYYGQTYPHLKVSCIEDRSQIYTTKINNYFKNHPHYNLILKLFFSIVIDLSIAYTLIVWSIYSTNVRFISTGISFIILNFLCRFIHIQIQPENAAYNSNYFYSIFVNYQATSYSFYPLLPGLLIICGFEWKRNNKISIFSFFIFLFLGDSFILVALRGNYFHEIFSSALTGHYLLFINEEILTKIFGDEYLNNDLDNTDSNKTNSEENELIYFEGILKKKEDDTRIELMKIH